VVGTQEEPPSVVELKTPHLLKPPPPHTSDPVQVPQLRIPPQPSPFWPHVNPRDAHVLAIHEGVFPLSSTEASNDAPGTPQTLYPAAPQT